MTIRAYPMAARQASFVTDRGDEVTMRPMMKTDKDALLDFLRRVPEEDRFYLKDDVTSASVVSQWAAHLEYCRTLPILAFAGDKVIGDATLRRFRSGARRHVGEVHILVDPCHGGSGVGTRLMTTLAEVAREEGLEKLMFDVVAEVGIAARHTAHKLGFVPVTALRNYVRDIWVDLHDLVTMELVLVPTDVEPLVF